MRAKTLIVCLASVAMMILAGCATTTMETDVYADDLSSLYFDDADLAGIILAANQHGLDEAELARQKATSPAVRDYATRMIAAHRQAGDQTRQRLDEIDIVPESTNLSGEVYHNNDITIEELSRMEGANFDRNFMDMQVGLHEWAVEYLDQRFIPASQDPRMRDLLESTRDGMMDHLNSARQVRDML